MTVQEYIDNSEYPERIKGFFRRGGISHYIDVWMHKCQLVASEFPFFIQEYVSELNLRSIIQGVIENCEIEEIDRKKLFEADKLFKENTVEAKKSLDYSFEKTNSNWYYFRIPKNRLKAWGFIEEDVLH